MPTKNSKKNYTYNYRREFLINVWIFSMYTIAASSRITELCFNSLSRQVIIYMGIIFA